MPIADFCSTNIVSLEQGATLQYAAQLMKQHHVGEVVVTDSSGHNHPVGILTDRDIALTIAAEGWPLNSKIEEVMTRNLISVNRDEGVADVIERMQQEGVRRVVVVDEFGKLCGIVSTDDLVQLIAREMNSLGRLIDREIENEEVNCPGERDFYF